jgi:hypothetical protein
MAFNGDLEEEVFFLAIGFSTVFRRSSDGVESLFVGSFELPLQDCKFWGLGSLTGCSIVVNRAAGAVVRSLYVSTIGVVVGTGLPGRKCHQAEVGSNGTTNEKLIVL